MASTTGLGVHAFWSYSPALDVQQRWFEAVEAGSDADSSEPLNILLAQPSDVRHVLCSLSRRRRHSSRPLHFYIYDSPLETLARHLLLLQIVHDWELPVRQRAAVFLEVFGNAKLQERTAAYVAAKGRELIQLVIEDEGAMADLVDLSLLKFKDRDALEKVFLSWDERAPFDIDLMRDTRLRAFYETRYDHRTNLIDWDYQMALKRHCDGGIVHYTQFRDWRMTGIAFEFLDQTYSAPNRSMASYAAGRERRGPTERRGFWADVQIGPFAAFGMEVDPVNQFAKDLFKVLNKNSGSEQWRHNTVEVAVYNMLSYLWEVETGRPYAMTVEHDIYSGLGAAAGEGRTEIISEEPVAAVVEEGENKGEEGENKEEDGKEGESAADHTYDKGYKKWEKFDVEGAEAAVDVHPPAPPLTPAAPTPAPDADAGAAWADQALRRARTIVETMDGVKVFPLAGDFSALQRKSAMRGKMHAAVFSSSSVHHMAQEEVNELLAPKAMVMVESPKYLIPLRQEQKADYLTRVHGMARRLGWHEKFPIELSKEDPSQLDWDLKQPWLTYVYDANDAEERGTRAKEAEAAAAAARASLPPASAAAAPAAVVEEVEELREPVASGIVEVEDVGVEESKE